MKLHSEETPQLRLPLHLKKTKGTSTSHYAVYLFCKCLRTLGLFYAASLLRHLPVIVFAFLVLLFAGVLSMALQKPWNNKLESIRNPRQIWIRVGINGGFYGLVFILWAKGLQECGALRTIILEYSSLCVASFFSLLYSRKNGDNASASSTNSLQFKGDLIIGFGYFFLLYHHYEESDSDEISNEQSEVLDELGLVWGIILLLCSSLLSAVRERFAGKIAKEVGGLKQLNALSLSGAALVIFPLVVLDFLGEAVIGADYDYSVLSIATLSLTLLVALFVVVLDFYTEAVAVGKIESGLANILSLSTTFLFATFLLRSGSHSFIAGHMDHEMTWIGITLSFLFSLIGMVIPVLEKIEKTDLVKASSPAGTGRTRGVGIKLVRQLMNIVRSTGIPCSNYCVKDKYSGFSRKKFINGSRKMLRQILSSSDSRKIFIFLCINLTFMFVEFAVGFWTNSLGLISDAGHMFFDCAALFVGLFAAYIARWKADSEYTYGYGRFEVISGFINGIFLIFIAIFVVTESIERLSEPPELSTNGLLVTSIGGFFVNMVGLVFFHEHAHGGHESHEDNCDHEHVQSHHGHSHGHDDHGHAHQAHRAQAHHGHAHHGHSHGNDNMKGVFLHVLADLLGSVGVVISSLLIEYRGWYIADPICSLMISVLIFLSVLPLIKSTTEVLLLKTPDNLIPAVNSCLNKIAALDGVKSVQEPHLWRHSSNLLVMSLHIVVTEEANESEILLHARQLTLEIDANVKSVIQVCTSSIYEKIELNP
uniref:Cation efflux protein transmembrane domain-containing protein n=1 Tax=Aplanochytrium stocchinoi TaxID=215587 RepID=A0A7S3LHX4_9STRA